MSVGKSHPGSNEALPVKLASAMTEAVEEDKEDMQVSQLANSLSILALNSDNSKNSRCILPFAGLGRSASPDVTDLSSIN